MQLVCPLPLFRDTLAQLARGGGAARVRLGAGERAGRRAWLCATVGADGSGLLPGDLLTFQLGHDGDVPDASSPSGERGQVRLWEHAGRWQARGRLWMDGAWAPLSGIRLVGPGMHFISMQEGLDAEGSESHLPPGWRLRWARTLRATGEQAFWRLTSLHVGIVGAGRTGSVVAGLLGRLGIRKITLLDPDAVQIHNLGEMDVDDRSCGTAKVEAVKRRLIETLATLPLQIDAVVAAIDEPRGLAALRGCDVIFSCVDNDTSRLTTAVTTTRRLQILVDIGTGAMRNGRNTGGDVRLILPERCMLCFGAVANTDDALQALLTGSGSSGPHRQAPRPPGVGSLATLNYSAAAAGVHLLAALVGEQVLASAWLRIIQAEGALQTQAMDVSPSTQGQCLCPRAGWGDVESLSEPAQEGAPPTWPM